MAQWPPKYATELLEDQHHHQMTSKRKIKKIDCGVLSGPRVGLSGVPRVSGARGEDGNWRPFPLSCQTGKRRRRSPSLLGGLGRSPRRQHFWEHLSVNGSYGTHFWISLTPFSTCSKGMLKNLKTLYGTLKFFELAIQRTASQTIYKCKLKLLNYRL